MPDYDTNLLMIPGPVPVHPRVFRMMAKPIFGHRTAHYQKILRETVDMLRSIMKIDTHDQEDHGTADPGQDHGADGNRTAQE